MRRGVGVAVAALVMAVLSCPTSEATPAAGTLVLSSGSGEPGAWVAMRGRIHTDTRTRVELERMDADGSVTVATARTDKRGRFAFTTRVPSDRATASYRVTSARGATVVRTVVTGTTTRLTQDPDPTKEPIDRIGAGLIAISGDGRFVYYGSEGHTYSWDRSSLTASPLFDDNPLYSGGLSPSYDGRFLAYNTPSTGCSDKHPIGDIVVTDQTTGTTTPITVGDAGSTWPSISADGQRVSFQSCAGDLAGRDRNDDYDIFVGDTQSGQIDRVTSGNDVSWGADLSADGRWVAFNSLASNLVAHDTNHRVDLFLGDSLTGKIRRVSGDDEVAGSPSVSGDGRFVAYRTYDAERPSSPAADVYVWDRVTGRSTRVTAVSANTRSPQISDDGLHVAYISSATDIAHDDGNNDGKVVFVWDRTTRTTTRIVNRLNSLSPLVSSNGAHVAYSSGDLDMINGPHDVYLWDRLN